MKPAQFRKIVYAHYKKHGRKLPWRQTADFYKILVSEIMLQQTQVDRVVSKYAEFLKRFPNMKKLAVAKRADVLRAWQGLGYNRRAVYLHNVAVRVVDEYGGRIPQSPEILRAFRGIGPNTAASICAFAYNMPVVFIETNIRTVFLKYFFPYEKNVKDADILKLVKKTLDMENPRKWYWALMDLGSHIKRTEGNPNRSQSAHYAKQSKFRGSRRQLRGEVLRDFLKHKKTPPRGTPHREIFNELVREGLIVY